MESFKDEQKDGKKSFYEQHQKEVDSLVSTKDALALKQMRYKLLADAVQNTYKLSEYDITLSIPKVVRQGEFTFAISGIRKGALKRKLSPLEVVVKGISEVTLAGKTKNDFEFTISVSTSEMRRNWLRRFVWLSRYSQVEKIQEIYSNVCDSICETSDEMQKRLRTNIMRNVSFGQDSEFWILV